MAKLLKFDGETFEGVECSTLQDFYDHIKCDCIDIARREIGGTYYDIIVDDEGLFKERLSITALNSDGQPMLVGTLLFANHDEEGNTTSLSADDVEKIMDNITFFAEKVSDTTFQLRKAVVCNY